MAFRIRPALHIEEFQCVLRPVVGSSAVSFESVINRIMAGFALSTSLRRASSEFEPMSVPEHASSAIRSSPHLEEFKRPSSAMSDRVVSHSSLTCSIFRYKYEGFISAVSTGAFPLVHRCCGSECNRASHTGVCGSPIMQCRCLEDLSCGHC
jgi:hypothetical protein